VLESVSSITGVTFLLYKDDQGGAPLWLETQNVTPDRIGHYSVQLGTTSTNGLPSDLFVSGEARWLAVQEEHSYGAQASPRPGLARTSGLNPGFWSTVDYVDCLHNT
jgi:hypothetical protein